jgi:hypothetical protein
MDIFFNCRNLRPFRYLILNNILYKESGIECPTFLQPN